MYMDECLNIYLCIMGLPGSYGGHKRASDPLRSGDMADYELPCYYWELNSGRSSERTVHTLKS